VASATKMALIAAARNGEYRTFRSTHSNVEVISYAANAALSRGRNAAASRSAAPSDHAERCASLDKPKRGALHPASSAA